jgi:hypothetical protein
LLNENEEIWSIPQDSANMDYQHYLRWLEEGNEPLIVEYVPPIVVDEPSTEERLAALELVVSMVFGEDDANV